MKIVTIIGARPQFVKASSISREIKRLKNIGVDVEEVIIHTGQHFDENMSDIFFNQMEIPKPDYNLNINSLGHGAMTGRMLEKIEKVLLKEKPDWVIVFGDTNSTLAGSLAAKKLHIKIAHIEAGLRSFNMNMPEEINRILTDRISNILFCPTETAIENLNNEGYKNIDAKMVNSGDIMLDSAVYYSKFAVKPKQLMGNIDNFILVTIHRQENTDDDSRLKDIIDALNEISRNKKMLMPIHPRTRNILKNKKYELSKNIIIIDPVGYFEMLWLIKNSDLVMTDSGGLQKEAYFFKKHCITLRDETEWMELITYKFNVLVGADKTKIIKLYHDYDFSDDFDVNLYGDGEASRIILKDLLNE